MQYTPKLNLKKPDLTDNVKVSDLNDNADIIDSAVGELKEGTTTIADLQTENKTLAGAINEIKADQDAHLADYAQDTGAANVYAITLDPAPIAYEVGKIYKFKAANTNTGASTLAIGALTVTAIKKNVSAALVAGDIPAGAIIPVMYDGTNFQLIPMAPPSAASETVAGIVELATAAETTTGTDNTRAVHPAGLKVELDKKAKVVSGTYTGDGTDGRVINIGFTPKVVSIQGASGSAAGYSYTATSGTDSGCTMVANGFTLRQSAYGGINLSGGVFAYTAIG